MTTARLSSPQQSPALPLTMSHLKLTVQSLKVVDGKLSKQHFCWLVMDEVHNISKHRALLWHIRH